MNALILFLCACYVGLIGNVKKLFRLGPLEERTSPIGRRFAGAEGVSGLGTTYTLPNYHGMLVGLTPSSTPFLSAIGGLTPGPDQITQNVEFGFSAYDLRAGAQRARLEGADAPTAENRKRIQLKNVAQVHQETVAVSYTKLAAAQQLAGLNTGGERNVVVNEAAWQIEQTIKEVALDVNFSLLQGKYYLPVDNTEARKTRGLIQAIEELPAGLTGQGYVANVVDAAAAGKAFTVEADDDTFTSNAHGYANGDQVVISALAGGTGLANDVVYFVRDAAANTFKVAATFGGAAVAVSLDGSGTVQKLGDLSGDNVVSLLQMIWEAGGIQIDETATVMAGAQQKRMLTKAFITDRGYSEGTRNVGGVNLTTIETDFGRLNIMLERNVPAHKLVVASLEQCKPKFLEVPGKGVFFVEPLAKTGAQEKSQLYGEVGLDHGSPLAHGVLKGLKVR